MYAKRNSTKALCDSVTIKPCSRDIPPRQAFPIANDRLSIVNTLKQGDIPHLEENANCNRVKWPLAVSVPQLTEHLFRVRIAADAPFKELRDVHSAFPEFRLMNPRLTSIQAPGKIALSQLCLFPHITQQTWNGSIARSMLAFRHRIDSLRRDSFDPVSLSNPLILK